jgi:hypothetical protein
MNLQRIAENTVLKPGSIKCREYYEELSEQLLLQRDMLNGIARLFLVSHFSYLRSIHNFTPHALNNL